MHTSNRSRLASFPAPPRATEPCREQRHPQPVWLLTVIACLALSGVARAETAVQSARVHRIEFLIWDSKFAPAIDSCNDLIRSEAQNPLGYCLLGIAYHSINSQFLTNRYSDSAMAALDTAIALAEARRKAPDGYADYPFVEGSAYGYRALEQSSGGHWWAAFKDGHRSCKLLQEAFRQDSSLTDALLGVGDYHYWKSAKSGIVRWLPFVKDRREVGIEEIRQVMQSRGGANLNAVKSLLPIYLNEQQYALVIELVDSLDWSGYTDPSCLLHKAKAEIGLGNWENATRTLAELHQAWEGSPYFDSCGACEADFLKACILSGAGDDKAARVYLRDIYSKSDSCRSNAYFQATVADARKLIQ